MIRILILVLFSFNLSAQLVIATDEDIDKITDFGQQYIVSPFELEFDTDNGFTNLSDWEKEVERLNNLIDTKFLKESNNKGLSPDSIREFIPQIRGWGVGTIESQFNEDELLSIIAHLKIEGFTKENTKQEMARAIKTEINKESTILSLFRKN